MPGAALGSEAWGATPDTSGNVYIADILNCVVRKVSSSGDITIVAGIPPSGPNMNNCAYEGDGGPATSAHLLGPSKVVADDAGNLYICDVDLIRRVDAKTGIITTVAGDYAKGPGYSGDGGPATDAQLAYPGGIALDASGNLYIADGGNDRVRIVNAKGIIDTFAGTGRPGFSGDGGPAVDADLLGPGDVATDRHGNVYLTDGPRVRVVNSKGIIDTFAGDGINGYGGDGGPATDANLDGPGGVAVDAAGDLLIGDSANSRIRWVNGAGIIYTVAGDGKFGFDGDDRPARSSALEYPSYVGVDTAGNLYFTDAGDGRVRQVSAIANVNASTYTLTFPSQKVGTSSTQTITLTGVGPLAIDGIGITSTDGDFTETNNCPSTMASGASCTVEITFTPCSKAAKSGTVTVKTNGFFNPDVTVTLSGTGN